MSPADRIAELEERLERCRSERRIVDEEVQLLVQAERRGYAMERDLERQMDRMRKLNAFTLSTARARSAGAVVRAWVALIRDVYPVPMVVGVVFDDGQAEVVVHRDGQEQQEFQVDSWFHFYDLQELPSCQAVHEQPAVSYTHLTLPTICSV